MRQGWDGGVGGKTMQGWVVEGMPREAKPLLALKRESRTYCVLPSRMDAREACEEVMGGAGCSTSL